MTMEEEAILRGGAPRFVIEAVCPQARSRDIADVGSKEQQRRFFQIFQRAVDHGAFKVLGPDSSANVPSGKKLKQRTEPKRSKSDL